MQRRKVMFSKPVMVRVIEAAFSVTEEAAGIIFDEFSAAVPFTIQMFEAADFNATEAIYIWTEKVGNWYNEKHTEQVDFLTELRRSIFDIHMKKLIPYEEVRAIGKIQEVFSCFLNWDASEWSEIGLFTTLGPDDDWDSYTNYELEEIGPFAYA
jgi:hypothetical protein